MRPPLQWTIDPIYFSDGLDERYATDYAASAGPLQRRQAPRFSTPWYAARWHRSRRSLRSG